MVIGSIWIRPYVSTCVLSIAQKIASLEFGGDVVRAGKLQTSFGCCAGGVAGGGAILVVDDKKTGVFLLELSAIRLLHAIYYG
jgi:hypothetical protein